MKQFMYNFVVPYAIILIVVILVIADINSYGVYHYLGLAGIALMIYVGLYKVFNFLMASRAVIVRKSKETQMPIYNSLDIGKNYIQLEQITAGSSFEPKAKVDFIEKAQKLGADAIINAKVETTSSSSAKIDKGLMNFGNDPRYYSVKSNTEYYYVYTGVAIKFV